MRQQDVRKCRQLVCVGECWAVSAFFGSSTGCFFFCIAVGRVLVTAISNVASIILAASKVETRIHLLVLIPKPTNHYSAT